MRKVEKRGFDVVEHGAKPVGAASREQRFDAVLMDIQPGSQTAYHAFRTGDTRQFLRFVQQQQRGAVVCRNMGDDFAHGGDFLPLRFLLYAYAQNFYFGEAAEKGFHAAAGADIEGEAVQGFVEKPRGVGGVPVVHEGKIEHVEAVFFGGWGNIVGKELRFAHPARGKQRECAGYAAFQAAKQGGGKLRPWEI